MPAVMAELSERPQNQSVPTISRDSLDSVLQDSNPGRAVRLGSQGTQYDVTSFIGGKHAANYSVKIMTEFLFCPLRPNDSCINCGKYACSMCTREKVTYNSHSHSAHGCHSPPDWMDLGKGRRFSHLHVVSTVKFPRNELTREVGAFITRFRQRGSLISTSPGATITYPVCRPSVGLISPETSHHSTHIYSTHQVKSDQA